MADLKVTRSDKEVGRPLWEDELWRGPELYSLHGRRAVGTVTINLAPIDASTPVDVRQLRKVLTASFTKVADIFRDIDTNGDGAISREEFRRVVLDDLGLARVGATPEAVDALFGELDVSGDGLIEYAELHKVLRGGATMALEPAPRSMRKIYEGTRPNWSMRKVSGASGVMLHVGSESKLMRRKGRGPRLASSSSIERLALPKVVGALEPPVGSGLPTRSVEEVVHELRETPTEAYLNRTHHSRTRRQEAQPPTIPAEHKEISTAGDVWWSKGSLSPFPSRVLSGHGPSTVARADEIDPEASAAASDSLAAGTSMTSSTYMYEQQQRRRRRRPSPPKSKVEAAQYFGSFPFFNETTRIIPNVGILYEREAA